MKRGARQTPPQVPGAGTVGAGLTLQVLEPDVDCRNRGLTLESSEAGLTPKGPGTGYGQHRPTLRVQDTNVDS